MKFGKALSQLCVPEWKKKYVDYKALKKIIKVLVKKLSSYTKADKENADFHNKIISECVKVNHFYKKFEHTYLEKHKQLEFQLFLMVWSKQLIFRKKMRQMTRKRGII